MCEQVRRDQVRAKVNPGRNLPGDLHDKPNAGHVVSELYGPAEAGLLLDSGREPVHGDLQHPDCEHNKVNNTVFLELRFGDSKQHERFAAGASPKAVTGVSYFVLCFDPRAEQVLCTTAQNTGAATRPGYLVHRGPANRC